MECMASCSKPQSGVDLALDVTAVAYAAYLSDERKGQQVEVPLL